MKELYLKTEKGPVLIDQNLIEKYHLEAGDLSPYNRYPIVNKDGKGKVNSEKDNKDKTYNEQELREEGTVFTQSEAIDITQGVDSSVEHT